MDYVGYLAVTMGVITWVNVRHAPVKCWIIIIIIIVVVVDGGTTCQQYNMKSTVSKQASTGTTGILFTRDGRMDTEIDM
jgi:NhaP-type Na+/H+ and K+/H+ antiporter